MNLNTNYIYLLSFCLGSILNLGLAPFDFSLITVPTLSGLIFLLNHSSKSKFKIGWCFGFGHFLLGLYWISNSLLVEAESFWWLIPFALTLIPSFLANYIGIICWLFDKYKANSTLDILFFSSLWVIAEYTRSKILLAFPWNLIGYSLAAFDILPQIASIIGIYGLSFIVVTFSISIYYIITYQRNGFAYLLFILIPLITLSYGLYRLQSPTLFTDYIIRLVQPNIQQKMKWLQSERESNLIKQLSLTKENQPQNLKLIIWPEAAISYNIQNPTTREFIVKSALSQDSYLILGAIRMEQNETYNSIFALSPNGEIVDYYDKQQLVPFGEYIPLNKFNIPIINRYFGSGFSKGTNKKNITLPSFPSFSPLLCYEVIFNDLISNEIKEGWILNLTNDAWFGQSTGPYQHLAMAKIRSIEQGKPLIRVANTGITAIFDPFGRTLIKTKLNQETVIDYLLPKSDKPPIFLILGNYSIIIICIINVALTIILKYLHRTIYSFLI